MDLSGVLNELRAERAQMDIAINALELLGRRAAPVERAANARPSARSGNTSDHAKRAVEMKRAGSTAGEIAKALGIPAWQVYTLTKGVKRGKSSAETPTIPVPSKKVWV